MLKKLSTLVCGAALVGSFAVSGGEASAASSSWSLSDQASGFGSGFMYLTSQGTVSTGFYSVKYDGYASTIIQNNGFWDSSEKMTATVDAKQESLYTGGEQVTLFDAITKSRYGGPNTPLVASINLDNTDSVPTILLGAKVYAYGSVKINNGNLYSDSLYGIGDRGI